LDLIRINEVVDNFGVSSRTLRYYEEVGLLWSNHPENKTRRYYDAAALERLKQIIILRKLQIPIKDIVEIFKSESTAALIQAFADKLESLDTEISALSELRKLVDEFLHKMLLSGIKKISAITLLYEETEKRLATIKKEDAITFEKLSEVSREASRLHDIRIIRLPSMRVLTSRHKTGQAENLDEDKMQNLFADYGFIPVPGMRDCFMRKEQGDEYIMLIKIPDDDENTTVYADEIISGGLYAVASTFFENMDDTFILLREWVNNSNDFELDKKRIEMLEEILPWDIVKIMNKYQQDIFIPITIKQNGGKISSLTIATKHLFTIF
jgi:DNA-binding transcriptional MerR regulator